MWSAIWGMGTKGMEKEQGIVGLVGFVFVKEEEIKEEFKLTTSVDCILKNQKRGKMEQRFGPLLPGEKMPRPR